MAKNTNLWVHRFKKSIHLLQVYWHFLEVYAKIKLLKVRLGGKRELIAISLTQHFGDIVAAEPISEQIRAKHPTAYIIWIIKPIFSELLLKNPYIDEVLGEFCANQRQLILKSNVFDKVYNLQLHRNSYCPTCNVFVENKNTQFTPENYYSYGNLLTVQQMLAELPIIDQTPKVYIAESNRSKVDSLNLPQKYVVIHGQSNEPSRNWSTDKWQLLINYFIETKGISVIEIGLKSEITIKNQGFIDLCDKLSLLDTAEVIRRAKLYIGIDSGPAHFANAVGTYGILLLGKWANFKEHQPYSGNYKNGINVSILRSEQATDTITVEEVINQIEQKKLL